MSHTQKFHELLDQLEQTPRLIADSSDGLVYEQLTFKPSGTGFSFTEHVWHLRDIEELGYSRRISDILSETRPLLQDVNGGELAIQRGYNNFSFADGLAGFTALREATLKCVRGLGSEDLERVGYFEGGPDLTIVDILEAMRKHDAEHLVEVTELSASVRQKTAPA